MFVLLVGVLNVKSYVSQSLLLFVYFFKRVCNNSFESVHNWQQCWVKRPYFGVSFFMIVGPNLKGFGAPNEQHTGSRSEAQGPGSRPQTPGPSVLDRLQTPGGGSMLLAPCARGSRCSNIC